MATRYSASSPLEGSNKNRAKTVHKASYSRKVPCIYVVLPSLGTPDILKAICRCIDRRIERIDNLKVSSSTGVDKISWKVLKHTKPISSVFLCDIFSHNFALSIVPYDWKLTNVIPVHKNGDRQLIILTTIPFLAPVCRLRSRSIYFTQI